MLLKMIVAMQGHLHECNDKAIWYRSPLVQNSLNVLALLDTLLLLCI